MAIDFLASFRFMLRELWNFGNVFLVWAISSQLLGDKFHLFGFELAKFTQAAMTDGHLSIVQSPLNFVFPRMAQCTFYK